MYTYMECVNYSYVAMADMLIVHTYDNYYNYLSMHLYVVH